MLSLGVVLEFPYVHKHSCTTFHENSTSRVMMKDRSVFQPDTVSVADGMWSRWSSTWASSPVAAAPAGSSEADAAFPGKECSARRQVCDVQVQTASSDSLVPIQTVCPVGRSTWFRDWMLNFIDLCQ